MQDVKVSSNGMVLYVGTQGGGVYRLSYENEAPVIYYMLPSADSTIYMGSNEAFTFEVNAIDLNGESLTFTWQFDNDVLDETSSVYNGNTSSLPQGIHYLQCRISDGTFSKAVEWVLNINSSTKTEDSGLPEEFNLSQNYPNPFNPATLIKFALPGSAKVTLKIYNILGQEVKTLLNDNLNAGYHEAKWDALNLSSGVYIYRIHSVGNDGRSFTKSAKMVLLK